MDNNLVAEVVDDRPAYFYICYFLIIHIVGAVGVWYAFSHASSALNWTAVGYFFACHLSITIAAHRYYTHGAFKMHRALEYALLLLFSGTAQGRMIWWVGKHLQHHENEDIPGKDPHTPLDGFFHSHMGWLLKKSGWTMPSGRYIGKFSKGREGKYRPIMWQSKNYRVLIMLMAFGIPALLGLALGDFWGGLLVAGFTRLMVQYHATWVVNSVGHTFGEPTDNKATNFGWIFYTPLAAILTVGEAWHASHHESSAHWRLGRKWWQVDIGAYVIKLLSLTGIVWDLNDPGSRRRVPGSSTK